MWSLRPVSDISNKVPVAESWHRVLLAPSDQEALGDGDYRLCHHLRRVSRHRPLPKPSTNSNLQLRPATASGRRPYAQIVRSTTTVGEARGAGKGDDSFEWAAIWAGQLYQRLGPNTLCWDATGVGLVLSR
jgi:hypothetical protein